MKKKSVVSVRLTEDEQWIIKAIEKRKKKENRATISNTVKAILIESLNANK